MLLAMFARLVIGPRHVPRPGQGLVEYALIIGFVAVGAIVVLGLLSGHVQGIFQSISDSLPASTPTTIP